MSSGVTLSGWSSVSLSQRFTAFTLNFSSPAPPLFFFRELIRVTQQGGSGGSGGGLLCSHKAVSLDQNQRVVTHSLVKKKKNMKRSPRRKESTTNVEWSFSRNQGRLSGQKSSHTHHKRVKLVQLWWYNSTPGFGLPCYFSCSQFCTFQPDSPPGLTFGLTAGC